MEIHEKHIICSYSEYNKQTRTYLYLLANGVRQKTEICLTETEIEIRLTFWHMFFISWAPRWHQSNSCRLVSWEHLQSSPTSMQCQPARVIHSIRSLWRSYSFACKWWSQPYMRILRPDGPTARLKFILFYIVSPTAVAHTLNIRIWIRLARGNNMTNTSREW